MKQVIVEENQNQLDALAEECIRDAINQVLEKKPTCVLAIPGGRSVASIFSLMKKDDHIPWNKVHVFMVDERLVPLDHEDSNFKIANESFLAELVKNGKLPAANVHAFVSDESKPNFGAWDYLKELNALGGAFDVVLLSAGEDGHVAALFPHNRTTQNEGPYYLTLTDAPKPPSNRLTASRPLILKSKVGILLFIGEAKRAALDQFRNEKTNWKECPAKMVLQLPNWFLFTNLK